MMRTASVSLSLQRPAIQLKPVYLWFSVAAVALEATSTVLKPAGETRKFAESRRQSPVLEAGAGLGWGWGRAGVWLQEGLLHAQ